MQTRIRISRRSHSELEHSVPVLVILASVIIALAFPALILSLSLSQVPSPSRVLVIVRSWLCVLLAWLARAAPQGPTLQPTNRLQFITSATACHQSLCGIATGVLPNRPADAEAGGSGAAGGWAGPFKLAGGTMARPRPSMTRASIHIVYDLLIFILCPGAYTIARGMFFPI